MEALELTSHVRVGLCITEVMVLAAQSADDRKSLDRKDFLGLKKKSKDPTV